jgi:acetoacetyl-CoA synthetase
VSTDIPPVLWSPAADVRRATAIGRYVEWVERVSGRSFADYNELWRWSVTDPDAFWTSIWEYFGVRAHASYRAVRVGDRMPDVRWFVGAKVNYAEHLLGEDSDAERVAIIAHSQTRDPVELTFGQLREDTRRARAGLQRLGVRPGDRVAAYMPNIPETIVAFIATASLGAIWASCAPEFGAPSVTDRLSQIEPRILLAVSGYGFRARWIDRADEVAAIRAGLPTLEHVVDVPYGGDPLPDTTHWDELLGQVGPLDFAATDFDHPLYVLFSSGTTGLPKAITHGHGGMLLEHLKTMGLGLDLGPDGRLLQFTTTGWMMWNLAVSAMLLRASLVLIDGDPTWPDLRRQWQLAAATGATILGTSPAFVMACRRAQVDLEGLDLSRLRAVFTAGSPLPPEGYRYVYDELGPGKVLINASGGTDVCSALVGGSFWQPVYEGEISGPCLGADVRALDADGREVTCQPGEMIVAQPMPCMPLGFWDDPGAVRYRAAYFEDFPGLWRHGDWITISRRGTCVISGRSDATLNRGGVRIGTAELYSVIEELQEVADSLVVHLEDRTGGPGELVLFVQPAAGATLSDDAQQRIRAALKNQLSPRHVPDVIVGVAAIPRTLTGKKLETPVKRILQGASPGEVANRDALADPSALDAFVIYARDRSKGQWTAPRPLPATSLSVRPPPARGR